MLFRALVGLPPGNNTPNPDLNGYLKTHSFQPDEFEGAVAGVFLFGDPVLSVISTRLRRYGEKHFANCGAEGLALEAVDIFSEDALNYTKMFHAWAQHQIFPVAIVRYETLHENIGLIETFLGRAISLPEKRARKTERDMISLEDLERITRSYAELIAQVDRAPDVAFFGPPVARV